MFETKFRYAVINFLSILMLAFLLAPNSNAQTKKSKVGNQKITTPIVTFIELGSVNCIPCKMMQPVMKNVEKKYGSQVKVIFYDVWTYTATQNNERAF